MSKQSRINKAKKQAAKLMEMQALYGPNYGKVPCPSCKQFVSPKNLITDSDPFAHEIYNDRTVVTQCERCYKDSCDSI